MEEDESHDPGPIGFLGSRAQVTETHRTLIALAELGAEAGTGFPHAMDCGLRGRPGIQPRAHRCPAEG